MVNLRADGNFYCSSSQSEDGTLVHRHAQPEGQAGTLNFFQQRICVTWKQRKQLMERPTHGDQWRCRMVHRGTKTGTFHRKPADGAFGGGAEISTGFAWFAQIANSERHCTVCACPHKT